MDDKKLKNSNNSVDIDYEKVYIEDVCRWMESNFVCFLSGAKRGVHSNNFPTVNDMICKFKQDMQK